MKLSLRHAAALLEVAPPADLARAALRRLRRRPEKQAPPSHPEIERALAAEAPRLFTSDDPAPLYARCFPRAAARLGGRALRILDGEAEIFGTWRSVSSLAGDPKVAWELGRAGHLVELAAAARLHPELAPRARAMIAAQLGALELPPLDLALRAIHRLAAIELCGGAVRFSDGERRRWARSFLVEGAFLSDNLEDGGACPANHLLGDWVGLYACGRATGRSDWSARAAAGVREEAARQVGEDGAHFEASTAYHRFALELLFIAQRLGVDRLEPTLRRMLRFVRGYLLPDGSEPGFGDGDDARLCPIVERGPRDHSYLAALGVLFGEPRPDAPPPEELVWWGGEAGLARWERAEVARDAPAASFPTGGVHVLRSSRVCLALRSGGYGQHGVGGHAHNDQLSLVVHAHGRPLIVDSGTGSYTFDPVARDRFRGTAAHSTVIVGGEEQSPLDPERPFALPDRARAAPVIVEDSGDRASLTGAHHGYRRLAARVTHRRRVTLFRALDAILVEDQLDGEGEVPVELRFVLAEPAWLGASPAARARIAALGSALGALDAERAVEIGASGARAVLVPRAGSPLAPRVCAGWASPHFGRVLRRGLAGYIGLLRVPHTVAVAVLILPRET